MRALLINAVCGIRSTGTICVDIAHNLESLGYEVKIAYGREDCPGKYQRYGVRIGSEVDVYYHAVMTKLFDDRGLKSRRATKVFLDWAESYNPQLLWLHNLHDYFINIKMLFDWIKSRPDMEVKWTQHDCWAFTGGCMHFEMSHCNQWKNGCRKCDKKLLNFRPVFYRTSRNYLMKKAAFTGVRRMTIVTPSKWMSGIVAESFLNCYPIETIYNTIDLKTFRPTSSDFREKYKLLDRFIILGVASAWNKAKGLYDMINLAAMLDNRYAVVLVGLTEKQILQLPRGVIGIERTNNKKELAEIYSAADVFLNLTYQDTYPTVNLEAQACGTPVITYNTGGSPESVSARNVVEQGNVEAIAEMIQSGNYDTECDRHGERQL